jgi:hypothetical protein
VHYPQNLRKIGADPEVFVQNRRSKQFVSAHDMIPGTKENPHHINQGAVQVDGMALEFNINPTNNIRTFVNRIKKQHKTLDRLIQAKNPNLHTVCAPIAKFSPGTMEKTPEKAKRLGCEPDFNAYTGTLNPTPDENTPWRSASGHIHLGWTKDMVVEGQAHMSDCRLVVKFLDQCLYRASLLWEPDLRDVYERHRLFGRPGAFRPKPYGVEYRVLTNTWLEKEERIRYVFEITRFCLKNPDKVRQHLDYIAAKVHPCTNEKINTLKVLSPPRPHHWTEPRLYSSNIPELRKIFRSCPRKDL